MAVRVQEGLPVSAADSAVWPASSTILVPISVQAAEAGRLAGRRRQDERSLRRRVVHRVTAPGVCAGTCAEVARLPGLGQRDHDELEEVGHGIAGLPSCGHRGGRRQPAGTITSAEWLIRRLLADVLDRLGDFLPVRGVETEASDAHLLAVDGERAGSAGELPEAVRVPPASARGYETALAGVVPIA